MMNNKIVYIDIDDTLIRSFGSKQIPITHSISHLKKLFNNGFEIYLWSSGGEEYCKNVAKNLGIYEYIKSFLPKPNVYIDDQKFDEWKLCKHYYPGEVDKMTNDFNINDEETVVCYRPVGEKELELVKQSGNKRWPPRLPEQPIFYPVSNEDYAIGVTRWNVTDFGKGYVTKFHLKKSFLDQYPLKCVGASNHTEWWIPAEDVDKMNNNIIGLIELILEIGSDGIIKRLDSANSG